jgi:hypothetical protein
MMKNSYLEMLLAQARRVERLAAAGKVNGRSNMLHSDISPNNKEPREPLSARSFIRLFGDKVKRYRLTHRPDFVGLMVLGWQSGFVVERDEKTGLRVLRRVDVTHENHNDYVITNKALRLSHRDSVCNLQRGLLKWVH